MMSNSLLQHALVQLAILMVNRHGYTNYMSKDEKLL